MRVTAAILALVGAGFLAGGIYRELHGSDDSGGPAVVRYDLPSRLLGRTLHEVAVVPPEPRGLVVLLHVESVRPQLLAALAGLDPAPAVLLVGGSAGGRYDAYVLAEAIPDALERFDVEGKVAIGGRGAPRLAGADARRVCAARATAELRPLVRALRSCE